MGRDWNSMPHDELTYSHQIGHQTQEELIQTHCSGLDEQLRQTRSRIEAEELFRETCARFDQSCESSVVRKFLKQHAERLLEKVWGKKP